MILKPLTAIILFFLVASTNAQELTWADSIDQGLYKKERKKFRLKLDIDFPPDNHIYNGLVLNFTSNPAYAGYESKHNFNYGYRHKWPGLVQRRYQYHDFVTPRAHWGTYEFSVGKKKKSHFGLNYQSLRQGYHRIANLGFTYAFSAKLGSFQKLRLGITLNYFRAVLDWDKLSFGDQIDARYGFIYATNETSPNNSRGYPDYNAGLWYELGPLHLGLAVLSLTQPDEGFLGVSKKPRKYLLNPQYHWVINENYILSPFYIGKLYSLKSSTPLNTHSAGFILTMNNRFLFGLSAENMNAIKGHFAYSIKGFRIAIEGSFPWEKDLRAHSHIATFQGSIRYQFKRKKKATQE